jgi:hypothetical protein
MAHSVVVATGLPVTIERFNGRSGQPDLILYEAARGALAEASKIEEVKDIRDKAEAMAAYARQAKNTELIELATEFKVRAERRCGELLASTNMQHGGHARRARSNDATELFRPHWLRWA